MTREYNPPIFTTKHYFKLAYIIAQSSLYNELHSISNHLITENILISELIKDNPKFKPDSFRKEIEKQIELHFTTDQVDYNPL